MNLLDVNSIGEMCASASKIAECAIAVNNEDINLSTLTYMSELMYSMSKVLPEVLTLVEWRDHFGDQLYDHITVERKSEQNYEATLHVEFCEELSKYYGICPVLHRTSLGETYEEARSHVVLQVTDWIESLKDKPLKTVRLKIKLARHDTQKTNIKEDNDPSIRLDIDEGLS